MGNQVKPQSLDEQAVITDAKQAWTRFRAALTHQGRLSSQQLPDKIELLHAIPPFTRAVELILSNEDSQLNHHPEPTPSKKRRP